MAQKAKKILDDNGNLVEEQEPTMESALLSIKEEKVEKKEAKKEPKTYVFRLISNASPNDKRQYPPRFMLANTDIVFDEELGYKRTMRYLPGINTIWSEEQENLPENIVNRRPSINFIDGYLYVSSNDRTLVDFLTKSNRCLNAENRDENSPATYEMMNFEAISKKNIQNVKKKHEAMKVALSASEDTMAEHIDYLGITKINVQGIEKDSDELRVEYVSVAENNPDTFLKSYNNPTTKAFHLVKQALDSGKITENVTPGQIHWSETRGLVAVIPAGEKTLDYLVKFCFKDGEGQRFYDRLKTL